jgi:type II secretory pathway component GspD/PulD (secretin)
MKTAAIISLAALISQVSLAEGAGTVDMQFSNAPVSAAVQWIARLTKEPVIVPESVTGVFTYQSKGHVAAEEAIDGLTAALKANNLQLVNINQTYYRLLPVSETNATADVQRAEVEVEGDHVVVDGKPIAYAELPQALKPLVGPDKEIWVHDAVATGGLGLSVNANQYLMPLHQARPKRICFAYMPSDK